MPTFKQQNNIEYPKVTIGDIFRAFWRGMRPSRFWIGVILVSMTAISIIDSLIPLLYKHFFDVLAKADPKDSIVAEQLMMIIIGIAILNAIIWILWRVSSYYNIIFESGTIARLKQQAYDYMMEHSYGFFSNNFTGSLTQRVNRFARAFENLTDRLVFNVWPLFVQVGVILIVVVFIKPVLALILSIWAVLLLAFNIIFAQWKFKYDIRAAEADSKTTGFLSDTITNHNTIQLFTSFLRESIGFKKVTNEQANITRFTWNLDMILESVQSFFIFLIEFVLFYYAIKYWQNGWVTIGVFVLIQAYIIDLSRRLWDFTRVARDVYRSYADAKEMVEIMLLPHEIKDWPRAGELRVTEGKIEFRNVGFSFNQTREVLKNVNLVVKPGEKVALIGPSGAGKTTFVRLLLRLYETSVGKILIDEQDTSSISQKSLRKNISLVPQDPILFHRTLAENISYGKPEASREEIEKAGFLSHCDEFIKDLPYGYETYVGERGIKLSGGERQRVAIARAILKNAPILILDEATSSLDSGSESLIQDALNTLMRDKTTIVIAHRLSTIQKMDRIIVIDNGEIVEEGNHEALLAKPESLYKKLWSLQAGGFLKEEEEGE
jgi:ATP-binding cassette subfamily B protein